MKREREKGKYWMKNRMANEKDRDYIEILFY